MKDFLNFSERLRSLMDQRQMNTVQVARAVSLSHVAIGNYLSGTVPNAKHLLSIAEFFNVSADWMLGRDMPKHYPAAVPGSGAMLLNEAPAHPGELVCLEYLKDFLSTCDRDERRLAWTRIELEEHFPLTKWNKNKKPGEGRI